MARPTEPCGLWQSEQDTRPSRIGWRDGRFTSARCTLWQAKHTSGWVSLSRTRSCAVCSLWQEEHETSFRSCVLPGQCMRSRPWWQLWQTSFLSCADILLKRFGIGLPLFRCSLGSPWQVAQPTIAIGVRLSALVPCFPPQMSGASAWQFAQTLPSLISSADCARAPVEIRSSSAQQNPLPPSMARPRYRLTLRVCLFSRLWDLGPISPQRPKKPCVFSFRGVLACRHRPNQREGSPKVAERRGITIYFVDGSKLRLDFPKQTLNETGTVLKLKEFLAA